MPKHKKRKPTPQNNEAAELFGEGYGKIIDHPILAPLAYRASFKRINNETNLCPRAGWAIVTSNGDIHVHPSRKAEPEEWAYVLGHCLLHLAFGHLEARTDQAAWNIACDIYVTRFLKALRLGKPPVDFSIPEDLPREEDSLYQRLVEKGIPEALRKIGMAGEKSPDMVLEEIRLPPFGIKPISWQELFGQGLNNAVVSAVDFAGGEVDKHGYETNKRTISGKALQWFVNSFPLLGALAANFRIIENQLLCQRMNISVAAVDAETREIYMNPAAGLDDDECRFVMAHELLHVALRHHTRCQGRDSYLWNVACDYVINQWLVEMGIGVMPTIGVLYDPTLKGMSAEAVYDIIVNDMRRFRKLATLRGIGLGDMLPSTTKDWWAHGEGCTLDEFYRRALAQGLTYHQSEGRGFLPAGLVEEIMAQSQPPIPWDVELAQWFDEHFPPVEKLRSYTRMSRRQSATPDIPRPASIPDQRTLNSRTYGVVLDTSGSMDRRLLAKALGAIASYSMAHEVPAVRVVFCDAHPYDQGYMSPEDIAGRVKVRGRGGTILQPGINLLECAEDFPDTGPILIITDTECDRLVVRRDHAYLIPDGKRLPFPAHGPVFRVS